MFPPETEVIQQQRKDVGIGKEAKIDEIPSTLEANKTAITARTMAEKRRSSSFRRLFRTWPRRSFLRSLKRERIPATKLGRIAEIGSIGSPESNQRANSAAANLVAEGGKVTDLLLSVQRVICQVYDFREKRARE